jgi:hypothetical protein
VYEFFQQESERWEAITDRLQKFYDNNPGTVWTDDTLFLMTMLPYMPGRKIGTNAYINYALRTLVVTPVDLRIEPWTLETMSELNTVRSIINDESLLLPKEMEFDKKVFGLYKFSYAVILINEGDKDGGIELFKQLQQEYSGTYMETVVDKELAKMTEFKE